MRSLRRWVLNQIFNLLYGPLVLLHEPVGVIVFGPAWKGRRAAELEKLGRAPTIIEVGAGEGHLVREARRRAIPILGHEPSTAMRGRAWKHATPLVSSNAAQSAVPDSSISAIIVTYPGSWILEEATWREFGRVLSVGGRVRILAGGDVRHGRWSNLRGRLLKFAYGGRAAGLPDLRSANDAGIVGDWRQVPDAWGEAQVWYGRAIENESQPAPRVGSSTD